MVKPDEPIKQMPNTINPPYHALKQRGILFHAQTLWLFTRSDLKTVLAPQLVLASSNALSGSFVDMESQETRMATMSKRVPLAALWIWYHLLLEVLANQRLPASIEEDAKNKPWRPLPSNRLRPESASTILVGTVPTALCFSYFLGERELLASALLCAFTWLYNDLDGANSSFVLRNALNACGLLSFSVGATAITVGGDRFSFWGSVWLLLLWWIIFTTVQVQDLADAEGDAARGRKTMPLVCGDNVTRWSVATFVLFWSMVCRIFWRLDNLGSVPPLLVGGTLACRILLWRNLEADKSVWRLWCFWMAVISFLPLVRQ